VQQFLHVFLTEFRKYSPDFVFVSVVAVAFQSAFHSKIHQNNIFFIFKKLFLTSVYQNDLKILKKY
jgi:hypothetical protein